ncbi:MAG: hypothetical protein RIS70_1189 [Planctomycetota bacterium]
MSATVRSQGGKSKSSVSKTVHRQPVTPKPASLGSVPAEAPIQSARSAGSSSNGASIGATSIHGGAINSKSIFTEENTALRESGEIAFPDRIISAVPSELRLVVGGVGDHYPAHDFLLSVFRGPSSSEFQAQLEEPWYEPIDRLMVKHGGRIAAHVRMYHREIHFGSLQLPVSGLAELATSPLYRNRGLASALVAAAEHRMAEYGAELGIVRTTAPRLFARRGWVVWGRHCYSVARTRDLLAEWSAMEASSPPADSPHRGDARPMPRSTRIWRHVERGALMRLYAANTSSSFGPLLRSDDYWRWLVSRRGYGNIYVAIEGRDKLDLDETPIIGYAVTKEGRIVEMMTDPQRPYAVAQLLKRVCGDAIERDQDLVRLDAPPTDPLHRVFVAAGGKYRNREMDGEQVMMAKLFDPVAFLKKLEPLLLERIKEAGVESSVELGLSLPDKRIRMLVSRRNVRLEAGKLGRSYLTCSITHLTQMLLGQLDVAAAVDEGHLEASTRNARELATILFPKLPFWRPPWDELPA